MEIRYFSDLICPFCYIAEHSVMIKLKEVYGVSFLWLGMELHPETPPGGVDTSDARYRPFRLYVEKYARDFGLDNVPFPDKTYNTGKVLRLAEFARDKNKLDVFQKTAMQAYWNEGANLEDNGVLGQIAVQAGLDSGEALLALTVPTYQLRLDKRRYNALGLGVKTLPAFMWDKKLLLGCQGVDIFEQALNKS